MTSKKIRVTKDKKDTEKSAGNKKTDVAPITTRSRTPIRAEERHPSPKKQSTVSAKTPIKAQQQKAPVADVKSV